MATAVPTPASASTAPVPAIPASALLPWLVFGLTVAAVALYFVGSEQGATSVFGGTALHELVHDARHLLGYPCH